MNGRACLPIAVALLSACSSRTPSMLPNEPAPQIAAPAARTPAVLKGVYTINVGAFMYYGVDLAAGRAALRCSGPINGGNGLAVSKNHVVWLPSGYQGGDDYVFLVGPNCSQPLQKIVIPVTHGQPVAVTFDRNGNAYIENAVIGGSANVDVFPAGHWRAPKRNLVEPGDSAPRGEVADRDGNLYISYMEGDSQSSIHVAEFVGGKNPPVELSLSLANGCPAGLAIDKAGRLIVSQCSAILVFGKPYSANRRVASIPQQGPGDCSLGNGGKNLYCTNSDTSSVDVYRYDSARPAKSAYGFSWQVAGGVSGVAPDPPFGY